MNSSTLSAIRHAALQLPERDRAALAHDLVTSLDPPKDAGVAEAWDAELERRLTDIDRGTADHIDRETFRQRLRAIRSAI